MCLIVNLRNIQAIGTIKLILRNSSARGSQKPQLDIEKYQIHCNTLYNPFSHDAKAMIREMGNVELFKLCETIPKVQCSECLLYWNQGVIYCTCGDLLVESESSQNFSQWRLDALSIPHFVIKKGKHHCTRHGKTGTEKQHFVSQMYQEEF